MLKLGRDVRRTVLGTKRGMSDEALVMGVGSRGVVGLSSLQLAMCARAKKLEPRSLEHLSDKHGYPIGMCLAPGLPLDVTGYPRLLGLAIPAATEAAGRFVAKRARAQLPAVIALPERDRPGDDRRLDEQFLGDLAERTGLPIDRERSSVVRAGHAGGAFALEGALAHLFEGDCEAVLVGGVESYYHPEVLSWLDAQYRLHTAESFDGFIPGEGAAFAVLAREGQGARGRVRRVLTGMELTAIDGDAVNTADVATSQLAEVLARGPLHWVITDLNGERHRAREWSLLEVRHRLTPDQVEHDRLVEAIGDVGAASGALYLNYACELWRARCAPDRRVAILLASEGAERGLILAEAVA